MRERAAAPGMDPSPLRGPPLMDFVRGEIARWRAVAREAGLKFD